MRMAFCSVVAILLIGCNRTPPPPGMAFSPGSYLSPTGQYKLVVDVLADGVIQYEVKDTAADQTQFSDGGFSKYQRWFFYWSPGDELWVYSSDDGTFAVWSKNADGSWTRQNVKDTPQYREAMPQPVVDYLPDSLKKMWDVAKPT